jgi:hypothetical protein
MKLSRITLAVAAALTLGGAAQSQDQIQVATDKQLELVYLTDLGKENPVQQQTLYVKYYDETTKKSILKTVVTDVSGVASLIVPGREDGSSCVFQIVLSEKQFSKAGAFRIAPKPYGGQSKLTIQIDLKLRAKFLGAWVQLMRFPVDGAQVDFGGDIMGPGSSFYLVYK